jgi:hypothetical protein
MTIEILLIVLFLAINLVAGIHGTKNSEVVARLNLFLAGALSIQLVYVIGAL